MRLRNRAASKVLLMGIASLLLLSSYADAVHAFTNGQKASVVLGQKNFISFVCTTSQSGLCGPNNVAFDSLGNMWVADHLNHRVLEFKPPFTTGMNASVVIGQNSFIESNSPISQSGFGPAGHYGTQFALFDSSGDLWVIGYVRVLEFKPPYISGMPASLVIGQKDFTSTASVGNVYGYGRCTRDEVGYPAAGAFDSSGNLWVDDGLYNRVLEFSPPFSNGMNASLVIGQKDFVHCAPHLSQSGLNSEFSSMAFDPSGNLWVGDGTNNRILEFRPPFSTGMNASLVFGQKDFVTGPPAALSSFADCGANGLGYACAFSFDPTGNLWLMYNSTAYEFKPPYSSGMTTQQASLEIGKRTLNGTGANFGFDPSGNLWVPDFSNNRILEFACGDSCVTSESTKVTSATSQTGISFWTILAAAAVLLTLSLAAVFLRKSRSHPR